MIGTASAVLAEARVRDTVADCLGVSREQLTPEVSLVDDLAADSLDLAELAIALESELGMTVAERVMAEVRTYGELVAALDGLRASTRVPPKVQSEVQRSLEPRPGKTTWPRTAPPTSHTCWTRGIVAS